MPEKKKYLKFSLCPLFKEENPRNMLHARIGVTKKWKDQKDNKKEKQEKYIGQCTILKGWKTSHQPSRWLRKSISHLIWTATKLEIDREVMKKRINEKCLIGSKLTFYISFVLLGEIQSVSFSLYFSLRIVPKKIFRIVSI